jgi:hypothetical protein
MADDWYYKSSDAQHGPMSFAALRELAAHGTLRPNHTVRTGTEGAWRFADSIPDLFRPRHARSTSADSISSTPDAAVSSPVEFASSKVDIRASVPELWFYKLDDREHGPISLDELTELAAVSGETAREIVIRKNGEDSWIPLDSLTKETFAPNSKPDSHFGRMDGHAATARSARPPATRRTDAYRSHSIVERTISAFRRNVDLLVAATLLVALNAILFATMQPPLASERKYFDALRGIRDEFHSLGQRKTSPDEWRDFRARAEGALEPIIKDLEKTADAAHPIRQHLLWAGRDNLAEMLSRAGQPVPNLAAVDEDRLLFEQHMEWLEAAFAEQGG